MDWKKWIQRKGLGTPIWTDISGVSDTENKYHLTEIGYRVNSLSSACINLIATSLSEAPLKYIAGNQTVKISNLKAIGLKS